jgi:hypothetical protein
LHRSTSDIVADDDNNIVVVQLAKYGEVRTVDDGAGRYRETFQSMRLADRVAAKDAHYGNLIGHADVSSFRDAPQPTVDLHIADTAAGRDLMALVRNGTLDSVSVEFAPDPSDRTVDGVMVRNNAVVGAVAFALRPAHSAPILATRETPNIGEPTMAETATPETVAVDAVTRTELDAAVDDLKRDMLTVTQIGTVSPFADYAKYRSIGEYFLAADAGTAPKLLHRVLADQITTDNPGVVPPAWLSTVYGIIDRGRPLVTAFGAESAPASGMEIDWPFFDGNLAAIVAAQTPEKTGINSVKVSFKKGTKALSTFAGGSDISYQLLRRSSPSYLAAYMQVMTSAYAAETDQFAAGQAFAAATAGTVWVPSTGTLADLIQSLMDASIVVQTATGSPAQFAVVASDVFSAIANLTGLYPAIYGTSNVLGVAQANTLSVEISGINIIHDPYMATGQFIVSNNVAATWFEDGPMTVTAEDVELLGQNVAVWGMGAFAPLLPAGIIKILAT